MTRPRLIWLLTLALWVGSLEGQQKAFPEWRAKQLQLSALWDESPIVAIGDVRNVSEFGEQNVKHLAPPVMQDLHKLYWCKSDFYATAVVKGKLPTSLKKYVWASVTPGCALAYGDLQRNNREVTKVWFLRAEGDFLRPTFDGGARQFFGILTKWPTIPRLSARETLGSLLLTPNAISDSSEEFASALWELADISCDLLGATECAQRIEALGKSADPILRAAACDYLTTELGGSCEPARRH